MSCYASVRIRICVQSIELNTVGGKGTLEDVCVGVRVSGMRANKWHTPTLLALLSMRPGTSSEALVMILHRSMCLSDLIASGFSCVYAHASQPSRPPSTHLQFDGVMRGAWRLSCRAP